ncbi:MAG: ATP-binding protein, partial [Caldimonas sp.]
LTNLLTNAAKYTDPHGHIELRVQLQGGEVQFDVTDNGVGLSAEQLPTMFEMFRQVQGTMDRAEGGLGIGLALSKGLVELHGGRIDAFSAGPGLGARFRVTLPTGRPTSGHCVGEHSDASGAPEGDAVLTVLVADDNVDAATALALQLEIEGCRVELAHDGVHAFDLAMQARPQMALLDIGMPGMDGYRLATTLRSQAWGGEMFLVAITGWGQEEDRRKATAAGFDEHLTKPVSPEAILELISRRRQSAAAR